MKINEQLVDFIIDRAKKSNFGLREIRSPFTLETETPEGLATTLVKSFHGKYDLISVFTAAFNLIHEGGLSNQMIQIDADGLIRECPLPEETNPEAARPIIFTDDLFRAIVEGRKTQTRRLLKPQPVDALVDWIEPDLNNVFRAGTNAGEMPEFGFWKSPFGVVGNHLWTQNLGFKSIVILEITGIRVEKLHQISEEDAKLEGVEGVEPSEIFFNFFALWDLIYGKGASDQNPWVWVIEFKVVTHNL